MWLGCGQMFEAYRSWGCVLPTMKWEEFRYIYVVTEALPQTIVQSAIIVENTANHDFENIPLVSAGSVLFTIFSLAYALTERACMPPGQYHRTYFAQIIMANPCSQEAKLRICLLLFFFTDTLLRVIAFAEFINLEPLIPWNWIAVAVIFPIYILSEWDGADPFKQTLMKSFSSLFANDALLAIKSGDDKNISKRLRQMAFNVFVICGFLTPVFWIMDGRHTDHLMLIAASALFINLVCMIPSIYYKYYRNDLNKLWELQKGHQCECPAVEIDGEI